jgi:hypothetical protein
VIELLVISLLAVAVFWAFAEWRLGLLLCLATAILQDPLRKLTPDQPVLFVVFVGMVFGAACLGAFASGMPLTPKVIFARYRQFATPFSLLLLLIIVQAFNSLLRFGNPMLPAIGLLTYLLPFPSIVFAYQLALRGGESRIYQFMKWYVVCIGLVLTTVYLEFSGYDWPVFGQVGGNLAIYDKYIGLITPYQGIFRASEIAAWHAMACACFVVLLMTLRKINFSSLLIGMVIVGLLVGIGILTGRRKLVVEVAAFIGVYFVLWVILQKHIAKLGVILLIAGVIACAWIIGQTNERDIYDESLNYSVFVDRTKTVFGDIPSRVVELGIAPVMWAYDSFGLLGAGLGVGTQGTQHFGGGGPIAGAAEGGLGKITLELGILGLLVMLWLTILVLNHLWRIMQNASQISPRIARLSYGLFSFLVANGAAFSVATQAYGDLFILLILSWTFGFLLAVPALLEREVRAQQPANFEELAPVFRPKPV